MKILCLLLCFVSLKETHATSWSQKFLQNEDLVLLGGCAVAYVGLTIVCWRIYKKEANYLSDDGTILYDRNGGGFNRLPFYQRTKSVKNKIQKVILTNDTNRLYSWKLKDMLNLQRLELPNHIVQLYGDLTENCPSLKHVILPNGCTPQQDGTFHFHVYENGQRLLFKDMLINEFYPDIFYHCENIEDFSVTFDSTEKFTKRFDRSKEILYLNLFNGPEELNNGNSFNIEYQPGRNFLVPDMCYYYPKASLVLTIQSQNSQVALDILDSVYANSFQNGTLTLKFESSKNYKELEHHLYFTENEEDKLRQDIRPYVNRMFKFDKISPGTEIVQNWFKDNPTALSRILSIKHILQDLKDYESTANEKIKFQRRAACVLIYMLIGMPWYPLMSDEFLEYLEQNPEQNFIPSIFQLNLDYYADPEILEILDYVKKDDSTGFISFINSENFKGVDFRLLCYICAHGAVKILKYIVASKKLPELNQKKQFVVWLMAIMNGNTDIMHMLEEQFDEDEIYGYIDSFCLFSRLFGRNDFYEYFILKYDQLNQINGMHDFLMNRFKSNQGQ